MLLLSRRRTSSTRKGSRLRSPRRASSRWSSREAQVQLCKQIRQTYSLCSSSCEIRCIKGHVRSGFCLHFILRTHVSPASSLTLLRQCSQGCFVKAGSLSLVPDLLSATLSGNLLLAPWIDALAEAHSTTAEAASLAAHLLNSFSWALCFTISCGSAASISSLQIDESFGEVVGATAWRSH